MTTALLAPYTATLDAAVERALDGLTASHAALLRHQLEAGASDSRDAALLCLLTAEALGGKAEDATPAAVALTALAAMGRTFLDLDAPEAPLQRWGMPRSLNAGDGFYSLAYTALLHADAATPERGLAAVDMLDRACRVYADELRAALEDGSDVAPVVSLSTAALGLGALYAGESDETVAALSAGDITSASIASAARNKLVEATRHLT